jgi:flagellar hook-length control protein FliK
MISVLQPENAASSKASSLREAPAAPGEKSQDERFSDYLEDGEARSADTALREEDGVGSPSLIAAGEPVADAKILLEIDPDARSTEITAETTENAETDLKGIIAEKAVAGSETVSDADLKKRPGAESAPEAQVAADLGAKPVASVTETNGDAARIAEKASDTETLQLRSAETPPVTDASPKADKLPGRVDETAANRALTRSTAIPETPAPATAPLADAELPTPRTSDTADPNLKAFTADASVGADALAAARVITRDASAAPADSVLTLVQAQAPSTATVSTAGLTPTVPAQVVAAPNELSAVILNALKNGLDPQEQLVVQLDPPELGRVSIDFKFDAQGVQQITITSDNPEALKRLRELHFELTEALRQNGLSDKNMSFQQHSEQQSQSNWQASEWVQAQSQVGADEGMPAVPAVLPSPAKIQVRDRLDLLL